MKKNIERLLKPELSFQVHNEKLYFIPELEDEFTNDSFDKIKNFFKKNTRIYDFLVYVIAPQYLSRYYYIKKLLKETKNSDATIINLGSGYTNLRSDVINVDIIPYDAVDVVCDITNLPFRDNSADYIINIAVLEHVPEPEKVIEEIYRVLKPGGKLLCEIPFMQGFHASPYDFQRYTSEGLKIKFKKFADLEIIATSPTGGMLWQFQEWLALVLSFGIKPLYSIFLILLMVLTFPIKFLDAILQYHPNAKIIASAFIIKGKK